MNYKWDLDGIPLDTLVITTQRMQLTGPIISVYFQDLRELFV